MAIIPTNVSGINANRFYAVCFGIYALSFICVPEKFLGFYWTATGKGFVTDGVSHLAGPMVTFFTHSIGLMMLVAAVANWRYQGSTGITFFNLLTMGIQTVHMVEVVFWNLYPEKLWIEQKQMWQIQIALAVVFVWVAYSGWTNSDKNSETSAPAASACVKSIGSWQVSGYNVNRLMGVFMGFYGICMLCDPVFLLTHYFAASSLKFPLFLFLSRMMAMIMIGSAAAAWNYAGAESLNFYALVNMVFTVLHFGIVLWGGSLEPENLGDTQSMWYGQMAINVIMVAICYYGYKDAQERGGSSNSVQYTPHNTGADPITTDAPITTNGSML